MIAETYRKHSAAAILKTARIEITPAGIAEIAVDLPGESSPAMATLGDRADGWGGTIADVLVLVSADRTVHRLATTAASYARLQALSAERERVQGTISAGAAAAFGRRGGSATSAAKARTARANGSKGGRPRCLATIKLDTPRRGRGRILWSTVTGQIRVAAPGQSWETAEIIDAPLCGTLAAAARYVNESWGLPVWDLEPTR